jgi:hypothetical protein
MFRQSSADTPNERRAIETLNDETAPQRGFTGTGATGLEPATSGVTDSRHPAE